MFYKRPKESIAALTLQIDEVSITTEKLAAGMEETADSTQEMNATSAEIGSTVESINLKAQKGSKRAEERLVNAIEQSKAVARINELASESGNTVLQIQNITKAVISAVENLSTSSSQLLGFIDEEIIKDYDILVTTGEQYSNDTNYVSNLVTDLSATSEELAASIQNMLNAINQVTLSANEGAEGTSGIAQKITVVVQKADEVVKFSEAANTSTEKLYQMVSMFKV